ncbi:MAG: hypothetical protein ACRETN_04975 [Nevskiales bacterium]
MAVTLLIVVATAVLSAALTLAGAYWAYRIRLHAEIEKQVDELGPHLEERVYAGAKKAGEELLPQFRQAVTDGFVEALSQWPASKAREIARTGIGLVGEGLDVLLGSKRPDKSS